MNTVTVKFGGTSLCDAVHIKHCSDIVRQSGERKFVCVSAPGKRFPGDKKITDTLMLAYTSDRERDAALTDVRERYAEITEELGVKVDIDGEFDRLYRSFDYFGGRDFILSRGEYLSAKIFSALTGYRFIDAAECIFFGEDGAFDAEHTGKALSARLADGVETVIPGFYGSMPNGTVKTFPRGGSDITGAIIADASGSSLYENWTDVSGFMLADPKIVDNPRVINIISYKELRCLSDAGASVLHEDAISPLRSSGIPVNIRNTMSPDDPGTLILPELKARESIAGIAGKKGYCVITLEKIGIGADMRALLRVTDTLIRRGAALKGVRCSPDAISLTVDSESFNRRRDLLLNELCLDSEPDSVRTDDRTALISVVGEGMPRDAQCVISGALLSSGIDIKLFENGADGISSTVGVSEDNYERAVREIYKSFA